MTGTEEGLIKRVWDFVAGNTRRLLTLGARQRLYRIGIIGPAGTGKTTLANLLGTGQVTAAHLAVPDESRDVETTDFDSAASWGRIITVPGQNTISRRATWKEITAGVEDESLSGLIYTVSAGYHSFRDTEWQAHRLYERGMDVSAFMSVYRDECQKHELDDFERYVLPALRNAPGSPWLLLAVTKADLWWGDRTNVLKYYAGSPISKAVEDLNKVRGVNAIRFEVLPMSLRIEKLKAARGQVLAANTAGYDHDDQIDSIKTLNAALATWRERFERIV